MIPVVFVNCSLFPFLSWILAGLKICETRNRNTLRALVGQRVLLAVTGRGRPPVVVASVVIRSAFPVDSLQEWRELYNAHRVQEGSQYDWTDTTRRKWLYLLGGVQPVSPFTPPEGVRHGRVWMEYIPEKKVI